METIKSFKDLLVWQRGMGLVKLVYGMSRSFPDTEKFGLISQIRRSAVSIPSNIAEGWGRKGTGYYVHFLKIAVGSLYEMHTQILIAYNLEYIDEKELLNLEEQVMTLSKMLYKLIKVLESRLHVQHPI